MIILTYHHQGVAPAVRSLEAWHPRQQGLPRQAASPAFPPHSHTPPLQMIMKSPGHIFLLSSPRRFFQPGECPSENSKAADIPQKGNKLPWDYIMCYHSSYLVLDSEGLKTPKSGISCRELAWLARESPLKKALFQVCGPGLLEALGEKTHLRLHSCL